MDDADQQPSAIEAFLHRTCASEESARELMGSLSTAGMSVNKFRIFCKSFADGVAYVRDKYGTEPDAIELSDEDSESVRYNLPTRTIFIPRKFISTLVNEGYISQTKTAPYSLHFAQAATMYGVEEAYHHFQFVTQPERAQELAEQSIKPGEHGYDSQPIEREALQVVQQAMKDFGYMPVQVGDVTFASTVDARRIADKSAPNWPLAI